MGAEDNHTGRTSFTVRLSQPMHQMVTDEAARCGVSASQLIREAALLRVGWGRGSRGEPLLPPDDQRTVRRLLEQLSQE